MAAAKITLFFKILNKGGATSNDDKIDDKIQIQYNVILSPSALTHYPCLDFSLLDLPRV